MQPGYLRPTLVVAIGGEKVAAEFTELIIALVRVALLRRHQNTASPAVQRQKFDHHQAVRITVVIGSGEHPR